MRNMKIQLDNPTMYSYKEGSKRQGRKKRVQTGWDFTLNTAG